MRKTVWTGRAMLALFSIGVALGIATTGYWFFKSSRSSLRELHRLEDLRRQFNKDRGVPRLLLLLSPT